MRNIESEIDIKGTYSSWICTKELRLFAFPISVESFPRICREALKINQLWTGVCENPNTEDVFNVIRYIGKLISMTDQPNLSEITAIISDEILRMYEGKLDGVVYPTVQLEGDGLNIAVKTDVVDKFFKCEDVTVCRIKKKNKDAFVVNYVKGIIHRDGKITYKNNINTSI